MIVVLDTDIWSSAYQEVHRPQRMVVDRKDKPQKMTFLKAGDKTAVLQLEDRNFPLTRKECHFL